MTGNYSHIKTRGTQRTAPIADWASRDYFFMPETYFLIDIFTNIGNIFK
jgi:hypothetical protein